MSTPKFFDLFPENNIVGEIENGTEDWVEKNLIKPLILKVTESFPI